MRIRIIGLLYAHIRTYVLKYYCAVAVFDAARTAKAVYQQVYAYTYYRATIRVIRIRIIGLLCTAKAVYQQVYAYAHVCVSAAGICVNACVRSVCVCVYKCSRYMRERMCV